MWHMQTKQGKSWICLVLNDSYYCRQYAWGHDELNAGSRTAREWFKMGLTIVDSLDTLLIAGLMEEYAEARHWVANYFDMNKGSVSVSCSRAFGVHAHHIGICLSPNSRQHHRDEECWQLPSDHQQIKGCACVVWQDGTVITETSGTLAGLC